MTTPPSLTVAPGEKKRGRRKKARSLRAFGKRLVVTVISEERYRARRDARRMDRNKTLLIVHTMGKVGSTTVAASLKAQGIKRTMSLFQPHFLSDEGVAFAEALALERAGEWANLTRKGRNGFTRARRLNKELKRRQDEGGRVKVITMVRDPLATNVSGLFHNYRWWPAELKTQCDPPSSECLAAVERYFVDTYPHHVPDMWFDMEVRALYGIDVFAEPFDTQRGYAIYHSEFADLLVIKLEKLNQCAPAAMREFLGLDDFRLLETNKAEDKEYAAIYQAFRRELPLSEAYIDRMYNSRVAQHFYTAEERAAFRRKWSAAGLKEER
ncbi:MAG: putative capsular polysaccharide synthesis family protein [Chloroflexota bacterium]